MGEGPSFVFKYQTSVEGFSSDQHTSLLLITAVSSFAVQAPGFVKNIDILV